MFRKVFNLLASDPARSWNAHAFVSCALGLGAGAAGQHLGQDLLFSACTGWSGAYLFYRFREWLDEHKYRESGIWRKRRRAGITPKLDGKGDILAPRWQALAGWGLYLLAHWRT